MSESEQSATKNLEEYKAAFTGLGGPGAKSHYVSLINRNAPEGHQEVWAVVILDDDGHVLVKVVAEDDDDRLVPVFIWDGEGYVLAD